MSNRAKAEQVLLTWASDIDPSGINTERWKTKLADMSDDDFDKFMQQCRDGKDYVSIIVPNFGNTRVSVENNFKVAKKYGVKFFQRIWLVDPVTNRRYLSHDEYPVLHTPVRRQIQLAKSKSSYAKNSDKVDGLTGQVTGESAGGAISYPEVLVLQSRGLDKTVTEQTWARGGNDGATRAMNKLIHKTGSVSLHELENYSTGVKSTTTLSTYLKAAHINNNLAG